MSIGIWQVIILFLAIVIALVSVLPAFWALPKIGKSPWMAILLAIPLVNIVYLYVLAFGQWGPPRPAGWQGD